MSSTSEILARLYQRHAFGIKMGLDVEQALLERLGHPEAAYPCLHVAGTNGKGSVCAMLESILRSAGFKTGLYTSPHLVRFNERIRINGQSVSDDELAELLAIVEAQSLPIEQEHGGRAITFFEFATAMAFESFRRHKVDLAVVETGLGGRLDATNVVSPLVSVITGISLEHTQWLGDTIEAIAAEKGGIIKPGRPTVLGSLPEPALEVLRRMAGERRSRVVFSDEAVTVRRTRQTPVGQTLNIESASEHYGSVILPLLGRRQMGNVAVVVAALEAAFESTDWRVPVEAVREGLSRVQWPARFQIIRQDPPVILDGAHNPEAADVLVETLREVYKKRPVGLVVGLCQDKDRRRFLKAFYGVAEQVWVVSFAHERAVASADLAVSAQVLDCPVTESSVPEALRLATEWAKARQGVVGVAGSLFLAGEVLALTDYANIYGG